MARIVERPEPSAFPASLSARGRRPSRRSSGRASYRSSARFSRRCVDASANSGTATNIGSDWRAGSHSIVFGAARTCINLSYRRPDGRSRSIADVVRRVVRYHFANSGRRRYHQRASRARPRTGLLAAADDAVVSRSSILALRVHSSTNRGYHRFVGRCQRSHRFARAIRRRVPSTHPRGPRTSPPCHRSRRRRGSSLYAERAEACRSIRGGSTRGRDRPTRRCPPARHRSR